MITHASVFSGIGGPEVAATMLGWTNLFHCEINEFGRKILDYHYPEAESYEDITKTDFTKWRGKVNVLTGGFPCQPFSYAGKRGGAEDDRYLWPHMFRCIDEIRPDWVVAGILTMVEQGEVSQMASAPSLFAEADDVQRYQQRSTFTLERICRDLETHGYSVQPILIPACGVGAPHRRDRVFIVAHTAGCGEGTPRQSGSVESNGSDENQQPREWGAATEWSDRFYAVLRHASDTKGEPGKRYGFEQRETCDEKQGEFRRGDSKGGVLPENTMCSRFIYGHDEEPGRERNIGNFSARNSQRICGETQGADASDTHSSRGREIHQYLQPTLADGQESLSNGGQLDVADTSYSGLQEARTEQSTAAAWRTGIRDGEWFERLEGGGADCGRWTNFPTVSPVHRGNDGLPFSVDDLTISFSKWRTESLKAYGNAIVPQVMYEIFRAIEMTYKPII